MRFFRNIIIVFLFIGLLSPVLCNENPLLLIRKGSVSFPFSNKTDYIPQSNDFLIRPLVPYIAGKSDFENANYKSPFESQTLKNNSVYYRHWLGTTLRGCDVLAGIIEGAKYAILIGLLASLISLVIGIFIGSVSAFSLEDGIKITWLQMFYLMFLFLFNYNLFFNVHATINLKLILFTISISSFYWLYKFQIRSKKKIKINFGKLEAQLTILFSSLPRLFFIVAVMGVFQQGLIALIILLGITGWMDIARLVRAEVIRIKSQDYYAAAKISGATSFQITVKHILPNLKPLIISVFAFSFAGAVLSEASLSFLGWGLPAEHVTWGSLIMEGRESFFAWWLVVFPGLCLSLCVYSLYSFAKKSNNDIYSL